MLESLFEELDLESLDLESLDFEPLADELAESLPELDDEPEDDDELPEEP